jgi:hypothetical protein
MLMNFRHPSCIAAAFAKKLKFNEKEVNSAPPYSNNECGITIDRDMDGVANIIYMLLIKKER